MRSTPTLLAETVPADDCADLRRIARRAEFFPYSQYFADREAALNCFLSKHSAAADSDHFPDAGQLHSGAIAAAYSKYLQEETRMLKRSCGRLEPIVHRVGRQFSAIDVDELAGFIEQVCAAAGEVTHLSTPVTAGDTVLQHALHRTGFYIADTILGYHISLADLEAGPVDKCIRPARVSDIPQISSIAHQCFSERRLNINRFNSDPGFDSEAVGDLYAYWTEKAVRDTENGIVLVYEDGPVSGFMSFRKPERIEKAHGLSLGRAVLSAVDPGFQKRGIYRGLLLAGSRWLRQEGAEFIEGKTQLSNVPVLSVWQKLGGKLKITYHTYHWSRG